MTKAPKVLILGGGFAGLLSALTLAKQARHLPAYLQPNLTLIDRTQYHTFRPGLYEVATYLPSHTPLHRVRYCSCLPLPETLFRFNINFLPKHIQSLNIEKQKALFQDDSQLTYDYAVLALGSVMNFYGIPGLQNFAHPFRTLEDALNLHQAVEQTIIKDRSKRPVNIVIGGAGPTGVELAGELHFFIKKLIAANNKTGSPITISLIEAASRILPQFSERASRIAQERLQKLGVKIINKTFIKAVNKETIIVRKNNSQENKHLGYDLLIWTGGVKPNPLLDKLPIKKDPKTNRAVVNKYLQALDNNESPVKNLFVIGDLASFYHPKTGAPLPATAWAAESQGELTGQNLMRSLAKLPLIPYQPPRPVYVTPLGSRFALFQWKNHVFKGFLPWVLKQLIELKYYLKIIPFYKAIYKWLRAELIFLKND